jgi:hypothetical protein
MRAANMHIHPLKPCEKFWKKIRNFKAVPALPKLNFKRTVWG